MKETIPTDSTFTCWQLISQARKYILDARQTELNEYEITVHQAHILMTMYNMQNLNRNVTLKDLAKNVLRGVNTISDQMTRMERLGLVTRKKGRFRSTLLYFSLTPKGIDYYHKSRKIRSIIKIMSVLSEKERQQLILLLQKIIKKAKSGSRYL